MNTDQQLIAAILTKSSDEHTLLKQLYIDNQPTINRFILSHQGNEADADDVFQEGLIVLYQNIAAKKFRGDSSVSTYLYAICKFIWYKKLRQKGRYTDFEADYQHGVEDSPQVHLMATEQRQLIKKLLNQLEEGCRDILTLTIYYDHSMQEVAEKMGFKNEQNARNKKYKCLKRLKTLVQNQRGLRAILQQL